MVLKETPAGFWNHGPGAPPQPVRPECKAHVMSRYSQRYHLLCRSTVANMEFSRLASANSKCVQGLETNLLFVLGLVGDKKREKILLRPPCTKTKPNQIKLFRNIDQHKCPTLDRSCHTFPNNTERWPIVTPECHPLFFPTTFGQISK